MNNNHIGTMKKYAWLMLAVAAFVPVDAQNMTDLSVAGQQETTETLDLADECSAEASTFLHPERIRYDARCFQIDGKDTYIFSGTMHYFRVARPLWHDRLMKMKEAGFNCVETYVPWNYHERQMPETVDDYSYADLTELEAFLTMAEEMGFYVILRPGPYICAEWDGGGFPQWIMRKKPKAIGTEPWLQGDDEEFLCWCRHWLKAVCRVAAPHQLTRRPLGERGIIMFQIENEYERVNWFSHEQKRHLLETLASEARADGIDVLMISCWTSETRCVPSPSPLAGVVDMVNSYPKWQVKERFGRLTDQQLRTQPGRPLISGELQGGWCCELDWQNFWQQDGLAPVQTQNLTLYAMQRGYSAINYYMTVGGTNFDDWAARNQTTSYDYAAAIGEDGSTNDRYRRLRGLADFATTHGTRIARAKLTPTQYESTDPDVELAVRTCENGDRYFFLRTEERWKSHFGSVRVDGLTLSFALEPFEAMAYYLPANGKGGEWFPKPPAPEVIVGDADGGKDAPLTLIATTDDPLPTHWTTLREGLTPDDHGLYTRHNIYYKTRGLSGSLLKIERTGKNQMNHSGADAIVVRAAGTIVPIDHEDDAYAYYRLPGDSSTAKLIDVILLYENKGLHHHTNASVERHWRIGPSSVWSGGKQMPLAYAFTEKSRGEQMSMPTAKISRKSVKAPMLRWNVFSLEASPDRAAFITLPFVGNGFIYVNGHCIGRTWKAGPQRRYYIPECWLSKDGKNRVAVSTILSK